MIQNYITINNAPSPGQPIPVFQYIKQGSFKYVEQVCPDAVGIRFGGAFAAQIEGEAYYKPDGTAEIQEGDILHYWQKTDLDKDLSDYNNYRYLKIGDFTVKKCVSGKHSYHFVAHNEIGLLDLDCTPFLKNYRQYNSVPIDEFLDSLALYIQTETSLIVNVSELEAYTTSGTIKCFFSEGMTARDILSYFAELCFRYIKYHNSQVHFMRFTTANSSSDWNNSDRFIISPTDQQTYTGDAVINGQTQTVTLVPVYYKENGLSYEGYSFVVPYRIDAIRLNGDNIYLDYAINTGNVYRIQNNVVFENLTLTNGLTDISIPGFSALRALTRDFSIRPFEVHLFPFRNPFRAGQILPHIEDAKGNRFSSVITKMELTDSEVILTCSGAEYYYGSSTYNYDLNADSNSLFVKINDTVSKYGDTMSGGLRISTAPSTWDDGFSVEDTIYSSSDLPGSEVIRYLISYLGKNDEPWGYIRTRIDENNSHRIDIGARNIVNGNGSINILSLGKTPSGTNIVVVTDPQAWRSALGIGSSGAFPLTIAQGGTNATDAVTAIDNLGGKTWKETGNISTNGSKTISFSGQFKGVLITTAASNNANAMYIIHCSGAANSAFATPVHTASDITVATATGKITITNGNANTVVGFLLCLRNPDNATIT